MQYRSAANQPIFFSQPILFPQPILFSLHCTTDSTTTRTGTGDRLQKANGFQVSKLMYLGKTMDFEQSLAEASFDASYYLFCTQNRNPLIQPGTPRRVGVAPMQTGSEAADPTHTLLGPAGQRVPCRLTSLADGSIFSCLPEELQPTEARLLQSGCLRLLAAEVDESATDATAFLHTLAIRQATVETVIDALVIQHQDGAFASTYECWVGLEFMSSNLHQYQESAGEAKMDLLRTSLCMPSADGGLQHGRQLAIRGILGVECPCLHVTEETQWRGSPMVLSGTVLMEDQQMAVGRPFNRRVGGAALQVDQCWDAFFHTVGLRPHSRVCSRPQRWLDFTSEDSCSICLDALSHCSEIAALPCRHRFHPNCILKWTVQDDNATCPMCRSSQTAVRQIDPDPLYESLSKAVGLAIRTACRPHDPRHGAETMLLQNALIALAEDEASAAVVGAALVPTSTGQSLLRNCFMQVGTTSVTSGAAQSATTRHPPPACLSSLTPALTPDLHRLRRVGDTRTAAEADAPGWDRAGCPWGHVRELRCGPTDI